MAAFALLLALAAVAGMAWQWFDQRAQFETLRQELAKKIAETDLQNKESRLISEQVREATKEAQIKIGVLESKLAESQNQQIALESLYQDLSRNRDEWAYAEIEQSLLIASQQLQLAGNVRAALIALQNADARLQRMERPQLTPLRKAISRDVERLKAVPHVDVIGLSARLDALISAVDGLPLSMEVRPVQQAAAQTAGSPEGGAWMRFWREAWSDAKQLVRVEHMEQPSVPLLAPTQTFFLRENLKLRLIGARLALLTRDQASYKADLNAARVWLSRYYDTGNKAVASSAATLSTLYGSPISIELPDLSATLDALRNYRQSRERGNR
ncbi:MAG TPA: uroporphyrinogen-III C-methyltransferase [Burkholderiales bacterium]